MSKNRAAIMPDEVLDVENGLLPAIDVNIEPLQAEILTKCIAPRISELSLCTGQRLARGHVVGSRLLQTISHLIHGQYVVAPRLCRALTLTETTAFRSLDENFSSSTDREFPEPRCFLP